MHHVEFTVEYLLPPSVNHYWQDTMYTGKDGYGHRGRKLSPEAKAWKAAVAIFARGMTVAPREDRERRRCRYRVEAHLHYGEGQKLDPDNTGKAICDGLKYAGVIHADHDVDFRVVPHRDDRKNPNNPRTFLIVESFYDR